MEMERGTADAAWCMAEVDSALRVVAAHAAQLKAEAVVAVREAEYRAAVGAREAAEEQVATVARARDAVEGVLAEQERERRQAEAERAAGTLSPESLTAFRELIERTGVVVRDRPTPTVLQFLDGTYIAEKVLKESQRRHIQGYVRLFAKTLGDRPLASFTRADVLRWVRTLEGVRTTYGKSGHDTDKPIEAILRESEGKATLGVTTIEKHVTHMRAFFTAAARHHRFASSDDVEALFSDIRLGKSVPRARKRGIWSPERLNALLATPIWTGTRSNAGDLGKRHERGHWIHLDAYWWLPILAIHTGARQEELAQLQHGDLRTDSEGRHFLYLTNEADRRTKNERSVRPVPLHPFLVELRVPDLFRAGESGRVFPELRKAGRDGAWGQQYSEDFTAYRRRTGLFEPLLDFHALRHTFITAMREQAKADPELVGRIVGHQDNPEFERFRMTQGYTHFSVAAQAEAISRLDWEAQGIGLAHLREAVRMAGGPRGRVRAADLRPLSG